MKRAALFLILIVALSAAGIAAYRYRTHSKNDPANPVVSHTMTAASGSTTPRGDVVIDARRQQLIGVRTVRATRSAMTPTIRAVGTVRYAETRLSEINLKIDGWIRDLFVDTTGQPV